MELLINQSEHALNGGRNPGLGSETASSPGFVNTESSPAIFKFAGTTVRNIYYTLITAQKAILNK